MRFQLSKTKAGKHGGAEEKDPTNPADAGSHEATPRMADDDQPCKGKSVRNDFYIEGLDITEGPSVISVSTHPESVSENLVILLSIYSLSGLTVSERDEPTPEAKFIIRKAKKKEQPPKPKRKLQETLARHPTTVVVSSFERELTKDAYPMETYLPSLALSEKNFWKGKRTGTRSCTAYWPDAETADDRSVLNKSPPSTIKLSRTMKRVAYQRDLAADRASHFRHKRIDLNISLSRGTELLRLGVTSIVISGNEEDEQLINAPIRQRTKDTGTGTSPRARCWTTQRKDDDKFCFSHDPTQTFSLADNATLSLGVRVVSSAIIQHGEQIDEQERIFRVESEAKKNEQEKSVIHLSDDQDLMSDRSLVLSESELSVSTSADIPFLGCCTSDALSLSMLVNLFGRKDAPEIPQFYTSKTTEATVTPIYLLSDISESTADLTEGESEDLTEGGSEDETDGGTEVSSVLFAGE
jgi:hypothetical protein